MCLQETIKNFFILSYLIFFHYNILGCMCSAGPFQYRWLKRYIYSSCYYHHQIGSIHLSQCYHIFPLLCVWYVCCIIFCYLLHTDSGKNGNSFSLLLCSLWWVQIVGYVLTWRSYSFICALHHSITIIGHCLQWKSHFGVHVIFLQLFMSIRCI